MTQLYPETVNHHPVHAIHTEKGGVFHTLIPRAP